MIINLQIRLRFLLLLFLGSLLYSVKSKDLPGNAIPEANKINLPCLVRDTFPAVKDTSQETDADQPLPYAEQMPQYKGGREAMLTFLSSVLKYPAEAVSKGISGKVYVQFVVTKEGKTENVKVIKGIGGGCDEEAVRIVTLLDDWIPARDKGKTVSVLYTLPVVFDFDEPLTFVEDMPEFKGGMDAMMKYLCDSLRYPAEALRKGISGRVFVQFVVTKDGKIKSPKVVKGADPDMDKEAIRVVNSFPQWVPGRQNGKCVPVYFVLPVVFLPDNNCKKMKFSGSANHTFTLGSPTIHFTNPSFPGGEDSMRLFVEKHMITPKDAKGNEINGIVSVHFYINRKGEVKNPSIIRKSDRSLAREALRLVKLFPRWIPAYEEKRAMYSDYVLELTFGEDTIRQINEKAKLKAMFIKEITQKFDTSFLDNSLRAIPDSTDKQTIYFQMMPHFRGGNAGLFDFLANNIRFPEEAAEKGISGRVIVSFVVDTNGYVQNVNVKSGIGYGCDEEVVRVVKLLPRWTPGRKDGKKAEAYFTVPVSFNTKEASRIEEVNELLETTQIDKDAPLTFAEQMPEFPGGQEAMMKFLSTNIIYPVEAANSGISGRVIIQFIVDREGNITNVKIVRSIGGGCDEEAVRVVKSMPVWIPGKNDGKQVSVFFTLPIVFTLTEGNKKRSSRSNDSKNE